MANVSAYWRPASVANALELLERPGAVVLGGGTKLNAAPNDEPVEVVDLQALRLDAVELLGRDRLRMGATATLQRLADDERVPPAVRDAARREQPSTLRAQATVGGCVATGDWESELLAVLLAHAAVVRVAGARSVQERSLEGVLAALPLPAGELIVDVTIATSGATGVARTARTPADRPIVAAVVREAGGVRRMALAGVAATPVLVDGPDGLDPPADFRGTATYRRALAATLLARAAEAIA